MRYRGEPVKFSKAVADQIARDGMSYRGIEATLRSPGLVELIPPKMVILTGEAYKLHLYEFSPGKWIVLQIRKRRKNWPGK